MNGKLDPRTSSPDRLRSWARRSVPFLFVLGFLSISLTIFAFVSRHESPRKRGRGERPNILLVTLCSFRSDRLGAAGYWRPLTPYLDSLTRQGVFFDDVVSASSWTKPAAASLLTGLTPGTHQLNDYYEVSDILAGRIRPKRTMPPGAVTLAELLRNHGYRTASRVNNVHAGEFFGITRGFEDRRTDNTVGTEQLLDGFENWLDKGDKRPFFFWLFTLDVHTPYAPGLEYYRKTARGKLPENEWEYEKLRVQVYNDVMQRLDGAKNWPDEMRRDWIDLYDAEVLRLDEKLSRISEILRRRNLASSTVIIVTADHGERFFEHGRVDHGWFPDQPTIKVPLIVVGPGISKGIRITEVVRSIDLYPTIAELAAADLPLAVQGVSLVPWLRGKGPEWPQLPAVAYAGREYAFRLGRFNLRYSETEGLLGLYDVEADFLEERNLAADHRDVVRRMAKLLRRQLAAEEAGRRVIGQPGDRELSREVLEQLRSLGYL